jgi:hypothetical protein
LRTEGCVGRKTTSEVRTRAKDGRGTRVNDIVEVTEKRERRWEKNTQDKDSESKKRVRPSISEYVDRREGVMGREKKRSKEGLYIALECRIWGSESWNHRNADYWWRATNQLDRCGHTLLF